MIKNSSNIETEIGEIEYLVPNLVIKELERISTLDFKKKVTLIAPYKLSTI
jgi:hypothetical protein